MKQQLFLEGIDRKERKKKLIALWVPEESDTLDGANNDSEKLDKLWSKIGETGTCISHKRIGNSVQEIKKRPIIVIIKYKEDRDSALEKAKILKEAGEGYKTIYIKKDVHPGVRK